MAIFESALAVSVGLNVLGNFTRAREQKRAARTNARILRQQSELDAFAARREAAIFEDQADEFLGETQSVLSRSGVGFSGSMVADFATKAQRLTSEAEAIRIGASARREIFDVRAKQAKDSARHADFLAVTDSLGSALNAFAILKSGD